MTQELKVILGISALSIAILVGGIFFLSKDGATSTGVVTDPKILSQNNNHIIATDSAKVTVVEFADFQCPACRAALPNIKQVLEKYKGQVNFVYRHYPLPQHKNAILAAMTAESAGAVGGPEKFWDMYALLFERQTKWSESSDARSIFVEYAKELQLDSDAFSKSLDDSALMDRIQKDKTDGNTLGVNSTPTFFINGETVTGNSFEALAQKIEEKLKNK